MCMSWTTDHLAIPRLKHLPLLKGNDDDQVGESTSSTMKYFFSPSTSSFTEQLPVHLNDQQDQNE